MKKLLSATVLMLIVTFQAYASSQVGVTPDFLIRTYDGVETFEGDRHNKFAGDFMAVLSDGSKWKVHPDDQFKYSKWSFGDQVHTRLRTSFYWFKREHKFELYNHTKKESVRVMIINYPNQATYVQGFQNVEVDRELKTRSMRDQYGAVVKDSKGDTVKEQYWDITYHRDLYLSDGTVWRIKNNEQAFLEGKFVYIGANYEDSGLRYFIISGDQREATHTDTLKMW